MAREKKPVHKSTNDRKRNIIHQLLKDIQSTRIRDALKDLSGGTIKEMMEAKWMITWTAKNHNVHISGDYRNGYKRKSDE